MVLGTESMTSKITLTMYLSIFVAFAFLAQKRRYGESSSEKPFSAEGSEDHHAHTVRKNGNYGDDHKRRVLAAVKDYMKGNPR